MKRAILHVASDLIPGLLIAAVIVGFLSVPDLMVHAIRTVVR